MTGARAATAAMVLLAGCAGPPVVGARDRAVPGPDRGVPALDLIVASDADRGTTALDRGSSPSDALKPPADAAPSPCEAIAPDPAGSAAKNWKTIQDCLQSYKKARLKPGVFPISEHLSIPASAQLLGDTSYPTLKLQPTATSNGMIKFEMGSPPTQKARVALLRLDAQNVIGGRDNAAIVFPAENSRVDNNHIYNGTLPPFGKGAAGVYVICGPCAGAEIVNNKIYSSYYGIIFGPKNTKQEVNLAKSNEIYNIRCDSITFMSFGVADGNLIHENGWDCENGQIPGGGIYTLKNPQGGEILNNTIYDNCGHGLDLDRASGFKIEGNTVRDPGYRWNGTRNHCGGGAAAFLLDISDSTIIGNTFENNNRPWNSSADSNNVTHAIGAPKLSDLPGPSPVIAFVLARRPDLAYPVSGNEIRDNKLRAACSSGCTGVGYFASRGTGYGPGNSWSASTTNYFTGNDPFGSNVGSKRCGGNWYAGNATCTASSSPKPCNADDHQHDPPAGDLYRNDHCSFY